MGRLLTVGHGTATPEELTSLLTGAAVGQVVDVRRFPGSRRSPALSREEMSSWLPAAGVEYHWEPRLGGRRRMSAGSEDAADDWWRVTAFRAYAAHMRSDEFREGFAGLLADVERASDGRATAIMCSESLWWRCHRRLVSDAAVLLRDQPVQHLGHDGRLTEHVPPPTATVVDDALYYPGSADPSGPSED